MEAEAASISECPNVLAVIPRAEAAGSVLNNPEIAPTGDLQYRLHVSREAEQVDRNDCARPRSDECLDLRHIEVERRQVYVTEDDATAKVLDHVGRSHPREGRNYRLVAGSKPERGERQVKGRRAGGDGDGVLSACKGRPLLLELTDFRPLHEPAASQRLEDALDLGLGESRTGDRNLHATT